jgi:hypothetical protein
MPETKPARETATESTPVRKTMTFTPRKGGRTVKKEGKTDAR